MYIYQSYWTARHVFYIGSRFMCISWASWASVMINMPCANLDLEFSGNLSFKYRCSIFKYFSWVFSMASKFDSWPTIRPSVQKAMAIVINISCVLSIVSISLLFNQELIFWNYNFANQFHGKFFSYLFTFYLGNGTMLFFILNMRSPRRRIQNIVIINYRIFTQLKKYQQTAVFLYYLFYMQNDQNIVHLHANLQSQSKLCWHHLNVDDWPFHRR